MLNCSDLRLVLSMNTTSFDVKGKEFHGALTHIICRSVVGIWKNASPSLAIYLPGNVYINVEEPSLVDHVPKETMAFPYLNVYERAFRHSL